MRILLTGATGYIGGWILSALARDHDVICAARSSSSSPPAGKIVHWDMTGPLPADMPAVDAVVHAAQSRHYGDFPKGAPDAFAVNCASTSRLLDWAAGTGVKSFCLVSSGSVYEPYEGSLDEAAPLRPTSLNGTTKLAAELLTRAYGSVLAVSRLRLFFPYGPGQTRRMVPGLIDRVKQGEPVTLAGQDGLVFAPLFAEDIAHVVSTAVAARWEGSFNVQGPEIVGLRQFVECIGELTGCAPTFQILDGPPPNIVAPVERLRAQFDISTMTGMREGLQRTLSAEQM